MMADLELDSGVKRAATPGIKPLAHQVASDTDLDAREHTMYRAIAARANYLAADRPDAQYSAKEICRFMSKPTSLGWQALKRLGRFLLGRRRLVWKYDYQESAQLEAYSDTVWAGCIRTRKSTSGGCLIMGKHVVKSWSSTQTSVSLPTGEAEFYGVVRAAGVALGQQSLLKDLGIDMPVRGWNDSSAAIGICQRQGLGKLRHIQTQGLWIQQHGKDRLIELRKVRGDVNPADLSTKHLQSRDRIDSLVRMFNCEYRGGRPSSAPLLRGVSPIEGDATVDGDECGDVHGGRHRER